MSKLMIIIVMGIARICAELLTLGEVVFNGSLPGKVSAPEVKEPDPRPMKQPQELSSHTTGDLDSLGLPWDERINSSGKTQYKTDVDEDKPAGAWILKRGISGPVAAQVRSELRLAQGGAPDAPPDETGAPAGEPTVMGFKEFVIKMSTQKPPFTAEQLTEACLMNGLGNIKELKDNPNSIPGVVESLWPDEAA